jgi:S-adenosylmethionine:tRNA ribosyltransferase-isomerase
VLRALLDYELPPELIATRPADERDGARLLVLGKGSTTHAAVRDLAELIPGGALVVVNDTRVIRARLYGSKVPSGGRVELLLVRRLDAGPKRRDEVVWQALGRASKPLRPGTKITFEPSALVAEILTCGEGGLHEVRLTAPADVDVDAAVDAIGRVPLPPYLRREDDAADRERYQTVFAREPGAVAAPTAGLHLSEALLDRMRARGIEVATVTLHVGLGTFQPVVAEDLDDHPMHAEVFAVPGETVRLVEAARHRGAPVVAVGTTVVRALETAADPERAGNVRAMQGETRLLIQPGYRFRVVDSLLTNFHLPQSTLLALVAAFAGRERVLAAYALAIHERYRFYSYGDAMLIRAREGA